MEGRKADEKISGSFLVELVGHNTDIQIINKNCIGGLMNNDLKDLYRSTKISNMSQVQC